MHVERVQVYHIFSIIIVWIEKLFLLLSNHQILMLSVVLIIDNRLFMKYVVG